MLILCFGLIFLCVSFSPNKKQVVVFAHKREKETCFNNAKLFLFKDYFREFVSRKTYPSQTMRSYHMKIHCGVC